MKLTKAEVLQKGDRIRLKVPLMSGWRGKGTVTEDMSPWDDTVVFAKDGHPFETRCMACRHEVAHLHPLTAVQRARRRWNCKPETRP